MTIEIVLPWKTPSVNHLYGQFRGRKFLKAEAKALREEIKERINFHALGLMNKKLRVCVEIHEDWLYKNGEVKRADISNREKFLIDSVFEALGLDDRYIYYHTMIKVQSHENKAIIKIKELEGLFS